MQFSAIFSFTITLALYVGTAGAICCKTVPNDLGVYGYCRDGTLGTPDCGVGKCKFYGCWCKGGCRTGTAYHRAGIFDRDSNSQDESKSYFDAADTNKDGKLSYTEWATSDAAKGQNMTPEDLAAYWKKYDGDGDGFLTEAEAMSRKM
ncbi:hypothetical protein BD779DRAFT_1519536 [Infundibulicybe gibba]|nr:hypothetical protein BD779DRAFT_1519536 [Infundibulicybe gibba]